MIAKHQPGEHRQKDHGNGKRKVNLDSGGEGQMPPMGLAGVMRARPVGQRGADVQPRDAERVRRSVDRRVKVDRNDPARVAPLAAQEAHAKSLKPGQEIVVSRLVAPPRQEAYRLETNLLFLGRDAKGNLLVGRMPWKKGDPHSVVPITYLKAPVQKDGLRVVHVDAGEWLADFAALSLIEKHGNKKDPGYRLLHPGRRGKIGALETQRPEGSQAKYNNVLRGYGNKVQMLARDFKKNPNGAQAQAVNLIEQAEKDTNLSDDDFVHIVNEIARAVGDKGAVSGDVIGTNLPPGKRPTTLPPAPNFAMGQGNAGANPRNRPGPTGALPADRRPAKAPAKKAPASGAGVATIMEGYRLRLKGARNQSIVDKIEDEIENDRRLAERDKNDLAGNVNMARDGLNSGPAKAPKKFPGRGTKTNEAAALIERAIKDAKDQADLDAIDKEIVQAGLPEPEARRLKREAAEKRAALHRSADRKARAAQAAAGPGPATRQEAIEAEARKGVQDFINDIPDAKDIQGRKARIQQALVKANGREDMHKILRAINTYLGAGMHRDQMMRMWDRKRDELAAAGNYKTGGVAAATRGRPARPASLGALPQPDPKQLRADLIARAGAANNKQELDAIVREANRARADKIIMFTDRDAIKAAVDRREQALRPPSLPPRKAPARMSPSALAIQQRQRANAPKGPGTISRLSDAIRDAKGTGTLRALGRDAKVLLDRGRIRRGGKDLDRLNAGYRKRRQEIQQAAQAIVPPPAVAAAAPKKNRRLPDPTGPNPNGKNIVAVEVAPNFSDDKALERFLDGKDGAGRKMFDPKRGDEIHMRDNGANADFAHMARQRGIKVVFPPLKPNKGENHDDVLDGAAAAVQNGGRKWMAVAFREAGSTDINAEGLPERARARQPKVMAVVLQDGYNGDILGDDPIDVNTDELKAAGINPKDILNPPAPAGAGPGGVINGVRVGGKDADGPEGNWSLTGPPWPPAKLEGTPAAEHFKNGGGLDDAPSEGLFDYIFQQNGIENGAHLGGGIKPGKEGVGVHAGDRAGNQNLERMRPRFTAAQPDRFRVRPAPDPGISPNYFVEELDAQGNVINWRMFKMSSGHHMHDIENEVLASRMLEEMGVVVPKARFARNPAHKGQRVLHMEHAGIVNSDFDPKNPHANRPIDFLDIGWNADRKVEPHRHEVLFMDIFDSIIGNGDRHERNWMVVKQPDGSYKPIIIDNGGGFQRPSDAPRAFSPMYAGGVVRRLYRQGQRREMEQDIRRIQTQLSQVDVDALWREFSALPGISAKLRAHYRASLDQFQVRRDTIVAMDAADIVRAYGI